jgi:DNA-binding CsgD family transcriptional regulator
MGTVVGTVMTAISGGIVALSEKAAAHQLGLSQSTVKHHLGNARFKVGATTTAQLVWILAPRLPEPEARVSADA